MLAIVKLFVLIGFQVTICVFIQFHKQVYTNKLTVTIHNEIRTDFVTLLPKSHFRKFAELLLLLMQCNTKTFANGWITT